MPTKAEWEAEELHQYGLIAVTPAGSATQLEKVTYDTAMQYLPSDVERVGTSLGSFSLKADLMEALLKEFAPELAAKNEAYDSDPHFWMPLTLKQADYVAVMVKKGDTEGQAKKHFQRMANFRKKFDPSGGPILACVDVGTNAYWWDYGRQASTLTTTSSLRRRPRRRMRCASFSASIPIGSRSRSSARRWRWTTVRSCSSARSRRARLARAAS